MQRKHRDPLVATIYPFRVPTRLAFQTKHKDLFAKVTQPRDANAAEVAHVGRGHRYCRLPSSDAGPFSTLATRGLPLTVGACTSRCARMGSEVVSDMIAILPRTFCPNPPRTYEGRSYGRKRLLRRTQNVKSDRVCAPDVSPELVQRLAEGKLVMWIGVGLSRGI